MTDFYEPLRDALAAERPIAVATIVSGPETGTKLLITPGTPPATFGALDAAAVYADALNMLSRGETGIQRYGDTDVFIETYPPPPTLYIVGAVHIAVALVTFANTLGFRTIVVDARGAFATAERFSHASELVLSWPDEYLGGKLTSNSYVVLLTHDPKLDDPALKIALHSPARYIGALGSPRTHAQRLERLRGDGMEDAELARLHAPVGLPIGARTPEEIAVSIIAEIVAARHNLTGKR